MVCSKLFAMCLLAKTAATRERDDGGVGKENRTQGYSGAQAGRDHLGWRGWRDPCASAKKQDRFIDGGLSPRGGAAARADDRPPRLTWDTRHGSRGGEAHPWSRCRGR